MYGYVRPVKDELKIAEFERYRAVYCGLCHELRRRYGPLCRFLVNYDHTFLAMLLADGETPVQCRRRCPSHPFRKTPCTEHCESLAVAADQSVILGWWKLRDAAQDKRPPASWGYKSACRLFRGAYRKAAGRRPAFAASVEKELTALQALETARCESLDAAADKFAAILRSVSEGEQDEPRRRALGELLYHLGRIVYILDAADDLAGDIETDSYNPLRYRFSPENGKLSAEDEKTLRLSLQHSHNALSAALALLGEGPYAGIISNIVYLGLPAVTQAVFAGTWKARTKLHRRESIQ